jgi:O-antigen/teichoic acid export membrane protein
MATKEQQIKNGFTYLLPIVVGNLIPIVTLPILTRILSKEDYGVLALCQVYAVFLTGICNFGLVLVYERDFFQHRDPQRAAELLYSLQLFALATSLLGGAGTYLFRGLIAQKIAGASSYGNLLFLSYCAQTVINLKLYYLTYFKNTENARSYTWYTIDETLIGSTSSLLLVAYFRVGVIGIVYGQLIASSVVFLLLSVRFLRVLRLTFHAKLLRDSLRLSYPLTPRLFLGVVGSQFDKYMLGLMNTIGAVGVYSLSQRIANAVFIFMTALQNVFSPQVYQRMFDLGDRARASIGRYLTPFVYASILVALLVSLFAEEVVSLVMPPSYHGAAPIITILCLYYGFLFFGKINGTQLLFAKKTLWSSVLSVVGIVLNVAINIPFILKWGAMGAAFGTLLAGLVSGAFSFIVSEHYYRIEWEYKKVGSIFLIFLSSSLLMVVMREPTFTYPWRLAVKTGALLVYISLGMMVRIITLENFALIKSFFPRSSKPLPTV